MSLLFKKGILYSKKNLILNVSWNNCENKCPGCYVSYLAEQEDINEIPRYNQIREISAPYTEININASTLIDFAYIAVLQELSHDTKRIVTPPHLTSVAIDTPEFFYTKICMSFSPWMKEHTDYLFTSKISVEEMEISIRIKDLYNVPQIIEIIKRRLINLHIKEEITLNVIYMNEKDLTIKEIFIRLSEISNAIDYPVRISPCIQSRLGIHEEPCKIYNIIDFVNGIPKSKTCPFEEKICTL